VGRKLHQRLLVVETVGGVRPRQCDGVRRIGTGRSTVRDRQAREAVSPSSSEAVEHEATRDPIERANVVHSRDGAGLPEGAATVERTGEEEHALSGLGTFPDDVDDAGAVAPDRAPLAAAALRVAGRRSDLTLAPGAATVSRRGNHQRLGRATDTTERN